MAVNPSRVVEVPLYAYPLEALLSAHVTAGIELWLYGGYPDSPLNGGRNNFLLDGKATGEPLTKTCLEAVRGSFWESVDEANRNGIPFLLAFTNLFCAPCELTPENLEPLDRLTVSGARHRVRNGVIVSNALLENTVRERFADHLMLVASCTKYVRPDRLLSAREVCEWLLRDAPRFDYVVITPQLSRDQGVLEHLARECPDKAIAIANAYCDPSCNSYGHYAFTSLQNKVPLGRFDPREETANMIRFARQQGQCSAPRQARDGVRIRDTVPGQLAAGIRHFKIGRGIGQDCMGELAALVREHDRGAITVE